LSAQNSVLEHIARPYATALFELASADKSAPAVEKSLVAIEKLISGSDDFARYLNSPAIDAETKRVAMEAIVAKAKAPVLVINFLKLVARNGRLFALPTMIASYKAIAAAARGEVTADVTSATALSAAQTKTLADTLKKKIGKTVTLHTHVDPSLIGGLQVKVGSQMIDSSLKTKLTAMKIAMKEVG
jgi:F-type H+-transporting ATPase subunit delta